MANTPLQNFGALLQNTYTQAGLMGTGVLATVVSAGVNSGPGLGVGVAALATGAGLMAHQRLSRMMQAGAPRGELPLTQRDIPDEVIRENLASELAERYPVLGDFETLRNAIVKNVFETWDGQGRLVDPAYPDLRGCVVESLIENRVAEIARSLEGATGAKERIREGLSGDGLGNRARRWAPRDVESAAAAYLRSAYPAFKNADYETLAAALARNAATDWLKADSPALMDKPGPATPSVESFVHGRVHKLMEHLSSAPQSVKLTALLRELRRNERRRSMESPTLFSRLQTAARELEILGLHFGQAKLPNDGVAQQLKTTLSALKNAPEAISSDDWKRFAGLEGKAGEERLIKELVGRLPALQAKLAETRTKEDSVVRERLRWLQAAVAGSDPVAGLDAASVGPVHPAVPEWARSVAFQRVGVQGSESRMTLSPNGTVSDALGFEVIYRDGGYWLRDGRGFSRLHPSNWLRAFVVNSQRMAAGGVWPLKSGDRLKIGPDMELEFLLPDNPHLERLRLRIARITSLEALAELLKAEGRRSLAKQIEDYLEDGEPFSEVPAEGGLAAKLFELVLRREAGKLHEEHLLNLPYPEAEVKMIELTRAVAQAASTEELARVVRESFLSHGDDVADAIERLAHETIGFRSFHKIPAFFGIRARAVFFAQEEERKLRVQVFNLEGEVSRLTGDLHDANSGIAHRDRTIGEASLRNEELTRQNVAARDALQRQEQEALAEKERIAAEHAAAMQREANIRSDMGTAHRDAQAAKDAAHTAAQAAKDAEHARLQAQKGADHRGAVARLQQEHTEAITAKDQEMTDQDTAHTAAIADRDTAMETQRTAHEAEVARKDQEHGAVVAAQSAAHRREVESQAAAHAQAMAAEAEKLRLAALDHQKAWAELEARRVAEESRANELARLRDEKEAARAAAQAEVDRLTPLLADAEATRDRYRSERNTARGERDDAKGTIAERNTELETEKGTVRDRDHKIVELTDHRDSARRDVTRLTGELDDANKELTRLFDEELPRLEKQIADVKREVKDMWSAFTDFEHSYLVYVEEVRRLVRSGGELLRIEEYLDKLEEVYARLDAKLKIAGQELLPAATAEDDGTPLTGSDLDPVTEEHAAVPMAFPDEVTHPAIKLEVPVPPPPPPAVSTSSLRRLMSPYFGNDDPRTKRVDVFAVSGTKVLNDMNGVEIGSAYLRAGNLPDDDGGFYIKANDGSILSGKTTIADAKRGRKPDGTLEDPVQEDGVYIATYRLPDGREVKILVADDGAGGMGGGDMVSSAFVQGIHAAVHQAAAEQRPDLTAGELFAAGTEAAIFQKLQPDRPGAVGATGAATVLVVIGGRFTAATIGDAMLFHSRPRADGSHEPVGYSDVDHLSSLHEQRLMDAMRMKKHGEFIIRGIAHITNLDAFRQGTETDEQKMMREPHLYAGEARKGDRFGFGSDGMIKNTMGPEFDAYGSSVQRIISARAGVLVRALNVGDFSAFMRLMQATAGDENAGAYLHDVAAQNQKIDRPGNGASPRPVVEVNGVAIELPHKKAPDNIAAVVYEEGQGPVGSAFVMPAGYVPLVAPVPEASSLCFKGIDPRTDKIQVAIEDRQSLVGPGGDVVGHGYICAGGVNGKAGFTLDDRSLISAKTSMAFHDEKRQEDGYYLAKFNLPDGTPVKVLAVSDGAGGERGKDGFVASSAVLQGVHAAVVEAALSGADDLLAGDVIQSAIAALQKQNELGVSKGFAKATGTVVVMVGNRATGATIGDSTLFYTVPEADGSFRTVGFSVADSFKSPLGTDTGLIKSPKRRRDDDDDDPSENRAHLYVVEEVPHGAIFSAASDGGLLEILGLEFTDQASPATRQLAPTAFGRSIPPPNRSHFQNLDGMLRLVSGQETAALHLHDFSLASMGRPRGDSQPIPFGGAMVTPPSNEVEGAHGDNIVWAVLQHAAGNYRPRPVPAGYGPLEQVVEMSREAFPEVNFTVRPGEISGHPNADNNKYLLALGRTPELNDRVVPHGTVSSTHAHLAFNEKKGELEANTWYLRPIKESANGTHVDGKPVAAGTWAALRAGVTVRLGGFPLFVTVGVDNGISFQTHPSFLPKPAPGASPGGAWSPAPPPPPSRPGAMPPPPPPASVRHPSRPPHFEKNGDGVRVIDLNGLDEVTLVSGSVVDTTEAFVPVKGKPKSSQFIAESGGLFNPLGGVQFVTVRRQGNGFRVENPHKTKSVVIHPPGAPKEGIEIKPGAPPQDVSSNTVVAVISGRSYRFRSERP